MALSPDIVKILVCPQCKGQIVLEPAETGLVCFACGLRYPVRDGIPVMLVDEAEKI